MNYWALWKATGGDGVWQVYNPNPVSGNDNGVEKLLAGLRVFAGGRLQECRVVSLPCGLTLSAKNSGEEIFESVKKAGGIVRIVDMENLGRKEESYLPTQTSRRR